LWKRGPAPEGKKGVPRPAIAKGGVSQEARKKFFCPRGKKKDFGMCSHLRLFCKEGTGEKNRKCDARSSEAPLGSGGGKGGWGGQRTLVSLPKETCKVHRENGTIGGGKGTAFGVIQ